ncbi:hypothetical protein [Pedobacter africanus]|uniref:Uncharacterized protein n=1 Tax=Pedobacter africanus TaxID=151894 RepID=A0ACC6L577_9SPHI|nr:hypothetical protein [Pedobacter africanus]MDR6786496.1 hypothetical protein [Pedobacter africanus]
MAKHNYSTELTFGHKFQLLRETAGRSEAETAMLLKTPYFSYLRLEADILYPTESTLRKVAKLYDITREELLMYNEA